MRGARWLAVLAMVGAASIWSMPVLAARHGKPHSGGSASTIGNDISWPQCGGGFPTGQDFGIVGVNDGLANTLNPCLGTSTEYPFTSESELNWAATSSTGIDSSQPAAQLYVNTADPGPGVSDWPTSTPGDLRNPYGSCGSGGTTDSTACAWQYGYNKASQDASWLTAAAGSVKADTSVAAYPWWLDVETGNTWQSGSPGLAMNVADLQGMVAGLNAAGVPTSSVGVYSTASQWDTITGFTSATASSSEALYGLNEWLPGARTQRQAKANCSATAFTGGTITTTQWTGSYDYDYPCQG